MKIALIGASGFIGSALREEALQRGHHVTALVSQPGKLSPTDNLSVVQSNVQDSDTLTEQLAGFDAVLSAFSGHAQDDIRGYYVAGIKHIIAASQAAAVPRLLVVGGAGTLYVKADTLLIDTPDFPTQYQATARGAQDALALLREETTLDWTMLSPAAQIFPGERTGRFRLGQDQLLMDNQGHSRISVQDFAVAFIDELENPAHSRQRFTLAY
ncbi:MAG: NAD(P)-dependent oxidoreductase [Alcanivorax sp.]|nr:NAD(P)-dependent oxidoreductase [Alcanivorax sp.]